MKITIQTVPGSTQHRVIEQLMQKAKLTETDRTVVGGHMSEVMIVLTYSGNDDHFRLFKDSIYIEIPSTKKQEEGYSYFYSLKVLEGYWTNDVKKFKEWHDKNDRGDFEIKRFD